ncbi:MAG: UDP-N-acetyl-D-glucosamine 2-epimerase, UDP-hydrolysing [Epulopiscium sp. Nele67-Bin004]|nr:MAG: UDP-N-acetyl-D-glucosamine 2-epimerase, UDP-hydrolysing [Epulopiscium sp. Nele67-Bin004]
MRNIMVVTGSRAEYGLLKNVIQKIDSAPTLNLQLVVTGSHLSHKFGYTIKEITADGFEISSQIEMIIDGSSKSAILKSMGLEMIQLAQTIEQLNPDIIVILGDRYEILTVAICATMMNKPLAHIAGGEVSYGANDEQIRHAITKMAHIHFAEADVYAQNIRNMGEEAWRVHSVGALGIENIKSIPQMTVQQLNESLGITLDSDTILMTYHPTTLESGNLKYEMDELLTALKYFNNQFVITYPNPDNGGSYIIERLQQFATDNPNIKLFDSLGVVRYLNVMRHCMAVVGNSSSALIEAPFMKKPVVNIGNRQEGRLMADNIIQCGNNSKDIQRAITTAISLKFAEQVENTKSLYGYGDTSSDIVKVLEHIKLDEKLLKKRLEW